MNDLFWGFKMEDCTPKKEPLKKHVIWGLEDNVWTFDGLPFDNFLNAVKYAIFKCKLENNILYVHEENGRVLFKLDYT